MDKNISNVSEQPTSNETTVPWNHQPLRYDGIPLYRPGSVIKINVSEWLLLELDSFSIQKNRKPFEPTVEYTPKFVSLATNHPDTPGSEEDKYKIAIVLDLDPAETFYKVLLQENVYWAPLTACEIVHENLDQNNFTSGENPFIPSYTASLCLVKW